MAAGKYAFITVKTCEELRATLKNIKSSKKALAIDWVLE